MDSKGFYYIVTGGLQPMAALGKLAAVLDHYRNWLPLCTIASGFKKTSEGALFVCLLCCCKRPYYLSFKAKL